MSRLPILAQADGIVAVDKPAGRLVIPGRGEKVELSIREQLEQDLGLKIFVVHRLDRDTSGVLVFALDAGTHRNLSVAFEAGRVEKRYLALAQGRLEAPVEVDVALVPARRGRMRAAHAGDVGKSARTRLLPLEVFERATLIEAQPLTGRTHQIRVHLSHVGHPLLVDPQYGQPKCFPSADAASPGNGAVLARTPLHARRLTIPGDPPLWVESPVPADMEAAMALLRAGQGLTLN